MPNIDDEWSRRDAEKMVSAIFDAAKSGRVQKILDFDGTFELRFRKASTGKTVAELLAEGSPFKE